jgi:uncharacterized protein (TIGR02246 family)
LANYERAVRAMDHDQVADLYAESGEIVNPGMATVRGRENIRKFFLSFAHFKLLENSTKAESTVVQGDSARQIGTSAQTVLTPDGKTVKVRVRFQAQWVRASNGSWLIQRMETSPLP